MKTIIVALLLITYFTSCTGQALTEKFRDKINAKSYPNIDAIIVSQRGETILEEYFNGFERDSLHQLRSSHKSITSLLAGIAVDQGLFEVNDEVQKFIPRWEGDPRGKITIKDLLEMKSGLACENFFDVGPDCESEMYETNDWLGYMLNIPARYVPGEKWEYSSMEPDLVGVIISRASRMNIMDFTQKYLFEPLNIEQFEWEITPGGRGYSAGSSYMKPLDMLKIAQLVHNKGKWKEQQVVSEEWIEESTDCQTPVEMSFLYYSGIKNATTTSATYGYLWYKEVLQYQDIKTEVLFASGNGGQYVMILEDYDAAIAFTGSNYGNWRGKLPFDILVKHIIPILEK